MRFKNKLTKRLLTNSEKSDIMKENSSSERGAGETRDGKTRCIR